MRSGLWALGRELSERARQVLVPVLLTALALSALVGFFQILLSIDTGVFRTHKADPAIP